MFDRWFLAIFLVAILLFGGSARVDSVGLVIVRTLAIAAIAFTLPGWWDEARRSKLVDRYRPLLLLLGAAAAWMVIQLIPLPAGLWAMLPGHGDLAAKMTAAGVEVGWRPLALSPGRAIHSLLDLLVPLAVVLVVGRTSDTSLRALPLRLLAFLAVAATFGMLQLLMPTKALPISTASPMSVRRWASLPTAITTRCSWRFIGRCCCGSSTAGTTARAAMPPPCSAYWAALP
ncbi:hypothetical protein [Sphingopyxis sp. PET50]|uniref:hypothetical protein n=1 Tax=Sphingopyxis sp. PET50 TaxID=2976533 RepID=UPI0021AE77DB|nr:hypothetical protein [Sphingopyxis sp. PET50]